jgi:hypothetical protein
MSPAWRKIAVSTRHGSPAVARCECPPKSCSSAAGRDPHPEVDREQRERQHRRHRERPRHRQPDPLQHLHAAAAEPVAARGADRLVAVLDRAALRAGLVLVPDVRDPLLAPSPGLAPALLPADQLPAHAHLVEAERAGDAHDLLDPRVVVWPWLWPWLRLLLLRHPPVESHARSTAGNRRRSVAVS